LARHHRFTELERREQDLNALRDRLDGIEPTSLSKGRAGRSVFRIPGGLDQGVGKDINHGFSR
jgi:hypothetical protein